MRWSTSRVNSLSLKYFLTPRICFSEIESFAYDWSRPRRFEFASIFFASGQVSSSFSPVGLRITTQKHTFITASAGLAKFFTSVISSFFRFASAAVAASTAGSASRSASSALAFSTSISSAWTTAAACLTSASACAASAIVFLAVMFSISLLTSTCDASTTTFFSVKSICMRSTAAAASTSLVRPPSRRLTSRSMFFSFKSSCFL
mmetsp:Transcript_106270/g.307747  ORF Transcript_106270/g.307747 Transcript_106270/m.307747 type:complete len:205 (-) Transcript_106270:9750-10364(-)